VHPCRRRITPWPSPIIGNEPYNLAATEGVGSEIKFVILARVEEVIRTEPVLYPYLLQVFAADVRPEPFLTSKSQPDRARALHPRSLRSLRIFIDRQEVHGYPACERKGSLQSRSNPE